MLQQARIFPYDFFKNMAGNGGKGLGPDLLEGSTVYVFMYRRKAVLYFIHVSIHSFIQSCVYSINMYLFYSTNIRYNIYIFKSP